MRNYPEIGLQVADILLPKTGTNLWKWAVIACDQFTSEPEYWEEVRCLVGDAPSTFHLILPEVFLGSFEEADRVESTRRIMRRYLSADFFTPHEGLIYLERTAEGRTRHGLMIALDLERYDYNQGSQTLIRSTEGTILDRLPPRIRIRSGAPLELPHILVLIDDPKGTVIEPLTAQIDRLEKIYDFELMLGSGRLKGYHSTDPALERQVVAALERLADPVRFQSRYGVGPEKGVLLYAMGDGNHSLATAKAIWEQQKAIVGLDHPSRYALVELENLHDAGLAFEPIHRVLFGLREDLGTVIARAFGDRLRLTHCNGQEEMIAAVRSQGEGSLVAPEQTFGLVTPSGFQLATLSRPTFNLAVGNVQAFLDPWLKEGGAEKIDYVHGEEVVFKLGRQPGQAGVYLPAMAKTDLFKTVIVDGALPRKTFSMGEAKEKRFYMECRKIA
ncbi:MAG: DUF1015 domain-containing protein [bacterium]